MDVVPGEVTDLLQAWRSGDQGAEEQLFSRVYAELRHLALNRLAEDWGEVTLDPTELVHETYLRLLGGRHVDWQNRVQFFAIAARLSRQVLVDHARRRKREKRGAGDLTRVALDPEAFPVHEPDVLDVHLALDALAVSSPSAAQLAVLRTFGGLTLEESAEVLGLGRSTAFRRWRYARAWLVRHFEGRGSEAQ